MEALIDAQLEFESIDRRIEGSSQLFSDYERYANLRRDLNSIGDYLHGAVEEYELRRARFTGEPRRIELSDLPALESFVGRYGSGPEPWRDFKQPFQTALSCVRQEVRDLEERRTESARGALLVRSRERWSRDFEDERQRLSELDRRLLPIEHIGCTAVPGMSAEPIIDLVGTLPSTSIDALTKELSSLGYVADAPDAEPLVLRRLSDDQRPSHQLFLVPEDSDFRRHALALRDLLRKDSVRRSAYDTRRLALWHAHREDPDQYRVATAELMRETLAEAEA